MTVRDIPCRTCQAPAASPCSTRSGRLRTHCHRTRHLDYADLDAEDAQARVQERITAYLLSQDALASQVADGEHRALISHVVWCDVHGDIHALEPDVYAEGQEDCAPANWRRVFVATDDPDEEF